jgi:hypothetical protein
VIVPHGPLLVGDELAVYLLRFAVVALGCDGGRQVEAGVHGHGVVVAEDPLLVGEDLPIELLCFGVAALVCDRPGEVVPGSEDMRVVESGFGDVGEQGRGPAAPVKADRHPAALGHSKASFTSDVYTSVIPEVHRAAAEAVAAVVPRNRPWQQEADEERRGLRRPRSRPQPGQGTDRSR